MPVLHSHTHSRANMYGLARHACHYERWAGRLNRALYRRVVADVAAAALPVGAVVLDVGTGPGLLPSAIADASPELVVVGVDLAPEMIARATERAGGAGRLRFEVADVAALPFPDGSVDLVVSSLSMHHWNDPRAGLAEVVRVLRPGAEAWVYDVRRTVRRAESMVAHLPTGIRLEIPLIRSFPLNPIGRLVLHRE